MEIQALYAKIHTAHCAMQTYTCGPQSRLLTNTILYHATILTPQMHI